MMTRIRSRAEAWSAPVLGTIMVIIGIVLAIGGGWLISLGGSFYYLPVGIGLIISGVLLWLRRFEGALLYLLIFLATLIWAWWEVGSNGWALVPRLVGPAILLVFTLAVSPTLRRHQYAAGICGRVDLPARRSPSSIFAASAFRRLRRRRPRRCRRQISPSAIPLRCRPAPTGRPMAAATARGAIRR